MHPLNYSRENLLNIFEQGAFRRYNVNKLLKAYEGKIGGKEKYKDCTIACKDNVITISNIKGQKDITIKPKSIETDNHFTLFYRIKYNFQSDNDKKSYRVRLQKVVDHLIPKEEKKPERKNSSHSNTKSGDESSKEKSSANESSSASASSSNKGPTKEELWKQAEEFRAKGNNKGYFSCMQTAADKGHYEGTDAALKAAFSYYEKSTEQGDEKAPALGDECYEKGRGIEQDEAKKYADATAKKSILEAHWMPGDCFKQSGPQNDPVKALAHYLSAANLGSIKAQLEVGRCYENGIGTAKDFKKSFESYKIAADKGSPEGAFELGRCYEKGIGVEQEITTAFENYLLAEKNEKCKDFILKNYRAKKEEGVTLFNAGKYKDSLIYLLFAADEGDINALVRLGKGYAVGFQGFGKNTEKSIQYYSQAWSKK